MNSESIKRARVVLKDVGSIIVRMKEREHARKKLYEHISLLESRPSKSGVQKLPPLVENAIAKERELVRKGISETARIKKLNAELSRVSFEKSNLEEQVAMLKKSLVTPKPIPKSDPKKLLAAKISRIEARYSVLEKQMPTNELKKIKEKIKMLKKQLKDL